MAISTCIKCGGTNFEIQTKELPQTNFKTNFIQCASCGGVVGIQEAFNITDLIFKLAKKLNVTL